MPSPVKIIPALLLQNGTSGQSLQIDNIGDIVWADFSFPAGFSDQVAASFVDSIRETDQVVATAQSVVRFDPSQLIAPGSGIIRTITFEALLWASAGMTAEIELYNLTDGTAVAGTLLTTTGTVPTAVVSGNLAVPAVLPNAARDYEVRLRISAGAPGPLDRALTSGVRLSVHYS
jgi:hypothetical protein